MVEILKPVKHKKLGIEAIHGHTCIELKDVRTGIRDRIESDNMVTDGAENLLDMMGGYNYWNRATIGNDVIPLAANLFGGLLLFNDTIPTSPAAKFMPAGVKMIGNGSYRVANSGAVSELGSYNELESTILRNKFEQVYDFSTQQANGVIKSVCLTSRLAGLAGYGNSSSETFLDTGRAELRSGGQPLYNHTNYVGYRHYAFYDNKSIGWDTSAIPSDATSITLKEYPLYCDIYNDFTALPTAYATSTLVNASAEHTVTIPAVNTVRYGKALGSKIYISSVGDKGNNTSFVVSVIDVSDYSVVSKTLTNTTGVTLRGGGYDSIAWSPVADNILWTVTSDNYIVVIDLVNETVTKSNIQVRDYNACAYITEFAPGLIAMSLSSAPSAYYNVVSLYDTVNATIYPMNMTAKPEAYDNIYQYEPYVDALRNSYQGNARLMPHPWRLTTINNLGSDVTKDATKTMKVTYTLTFS